jgi:hypothetical protein
MKSRRRVCIQTQNLFRLFGIDLTEGSKKQGGLDSWVILCDGDDGHCFRRLASLNPPQTSTMVLYTVCTVWWYVGTTARLQFKFAPAWSNQNLKVPKCEIFHRSDFHDFYNIKSLREGDFGV